MPSYATNQGNRDYAIRMGCEEGIYNFVSDYAKDMGMSRSGALRRLMLIGARCEAEHGKARMPASYASIRYDPSEIHNELHHPFEDEEEETDKFDWSEE